jgi:Putative Ig domain
VACTSAANCVGVGDYTDAGGNVQAMVASESSGTWDTPSEVTLPTGAYTGDQFIQFGRLNSVTCASPGNCVAVGSYVDGSNHGQAMVATETAGSWDQASEITVPGDANANPDGILNAVSCTSGGNCVAAGDYENGSGLQPMVVVESDGSWAQASKLTQPVDANTSANGLLNAVSCTSQGNCVAAGQYYTTSEEYDSMVATETAGSWGQASALVLPANSETGAVESNQLNSLSCTSLGNCVAAGYYSDTSDEDQAMTATESGGTWGQAVEFENLPSNALTGDVDNDVQDAALNGLVCVSNSECTAVGNYRDTDDNFQVMAVSTGASSTNQAPTITSASSTRFTAGTAGSFTVEASGVPGGPTLTLSDGGASLPSGVSFVDNGNGTATLSGTPAVGSQGSYPFTITAANGVSPNATQTFTLIVDAAGTAPAATISTGAVSDVTATTAKLNWFVQPDGDSLYFYSADCVPVDGNLLSVRVTAATPAGAVPADNGSHPLATPISGLRPGTAYRCGLSMGDHTGHSFDSYPAVEDLTSLTPAFLGFSAAPSVTTAQPTWNINPEGDSLASYTVACPSSAGNANAGGSISAGVLPADEASHPFTVALANLASGATYTCTLSLTDADGLTFSDTPRTVVTGTVSVPSTTVSNGHFVAVGGACGGSSGTVCSGNGEDVSDPNETPHDDALTRAASASPVVLGHFKFRIKRHHHGTIKFELTKAGRKLLLKHHKLATTLIITVKVRGKKVTTRNPLTIIYRKPKTGKH